jgi:phosphinothricin acetyltransferase
MKVINCDSSYADQILAIFNDAILNSTAVYDYKQRTPEMMTAWFEAKRKGNYPVIGMVSEAGELKGFGSYGTFRAWPGYKYTVEHSLYVATAWRRQGIGRRLLQELINQARTQNYHVLIGGIDSQNAASIQLHTRFGFKLAGTLPQVGFKFGRWLDLQFYHLLLETPSNPADG